MTQSNYISPQEAAKTAGVHDSYIRRLAKQGRFKYRRGRVLPKSGRRVYLIEVASFERWNKARRDGKLKPGNPHKKRGPHPRKGKRFSKQIYLPVSKRVLDLITENSTTKQRWQALRPYATGDKPLPETDLKISGYFPIRVHVPKEDRKLFLRVSKIKPAQRAYILLSELGLLEQAHGRE